MAVSIPQGELAVMWRLPVAETSEGLSSVLLVQDCRSREDPLTWSSSGWKLQS